MPVFIGPPQRTGGMTFKARRASDGHEVYVNQPLAGRIAAALSAIGAPADGCEFQLHGAEDYWEVELLTEPKGRLKLYSALGTWRYTPPSVTGKIEDAQEPVAQAAPKAWVRIGVDPGAVDSQSVTAAFEVTAEGARRIDTDEALDRLRPASPTPPTEPCRWPDCRNTYPQADLLAGHLACRPHREEAAKDIAYLDEQKERFVNEQDFEMAARTREDAQRLRNKVRIPGAAEKAREANVLLQRLVDTGAALIRLREALAGCGREIERLGRDVDGLANETCEAAHAGE